MYNFVYYLFISFLKYLTFFFVRFNLQVCPLSFPDTSKVAKECRGTVKNLTVCCEEMDSYVSHLQKQSFITNLQALDCASFLSEKLQMMNVSTNVYSSCQISLKDFSLQGKLKSIIQLDICVRIVFSFPSYVLLPTELIHLISFERVCFINSPMVWHTVGSQGNLTFEVFYSFRSIKSVAHFVLS